MQKQSISSSQVKEQALNGRINELTEKEAETEKELQQIKEKWSAMSKKNEENELMIKMLEVELA